MVISVKLRCMITFDEQRPIGLLTQWLTLVKVRTLVLPDLNLLGVKFTSVVVTCRPLWLANLGRKLVFSLSRVVIELASWILFLAGVSMLASIPSRADPFVLPLLTSFRDLFWCILRLTFLRIAAVGGRLWLANSLSSVCVWLSCWSICGNCPEILSRSVSAGLSIGSF